MEYIADFICAHAEHAHILIFCFLMLAGFNMPVSEDFMLIVSGMLASNVIPEHTVKLFVWTFLGCYLSDWEAYWLGRLVGPKIWKSRWFSGRGHQSRQQRIISFYERYGFLTLMIGRFIPFGIRNGLFMAAGMSKMSFGRFLVSDGIACTISSVTLFSLAFLFGKNYHQLYESTRTWNLLILAVFCTGVLLVVGRVWYKRWQKVRQQVH